MAIFTVTATTARTQFHLMNRQGSKPTSAIKRSLDDGLASNRPYRDYHPVTAWWQAGQVPDESIWVLAHILCIYQYGYTGRAKK